MDQEISIVALFKDPYLTHLNDFFLDNKIVRKAELFQSILIMLQENENPSYQLLLQYLGESSSLQQIVLVQNQYDNILDRIIEMFLNQDNIDIQSKIIDLLEWFLNVVTISKQNYKTIFTFIKTRIYNEDLQPQVVQRIMLLLQRVLEERKHLVNNPNSTFYFNHMNSGIVVDTREMNWMFQKGLTIQTWVQPLKVRNKEILSKLFYLLSDYKTGCQFILQDNKIYYQSIDLTKQQDQALIAVIEIPSDEWSSLNIQIQLQRFFLSESYYLYISVGQQQVKEIKIDFPLLKEDSQILEMYFFENFYGYSSCLLLFNEGFNGNPINCGDLRFGIQTNSHLKTMAKSLDKYASKLLLCYTPLRSKANFIIDPINKYDGALQQNCGSYIKHQIHQHINQYCRLENFAPLLLFLKVCPYQDLLNQLLELFCKILRTKPESQQEAVKIELLSMIALKINEYGLQEINLYTIEILSQMKNSLIDKQLKEQFIVHLLWRIQIYKLTNFDIINDYLQFIRMVYNSNPEFYIKMYGIKQIIEVIVYDIDPKDRLCCQEHAIQIGINNFQPPILSYQLQMEPYFNIVEAILFYQFFDAKQIDEQEIIDISKLFTQKYSPCFYQQLLNKLQKLLYYEKPGHHPISEMFMREETMQMLLNLLTTCLCPDVKTSCIKLLSETIRLSAYDKEKEVAVWIAHTLGNSAAVEEIVETIEEEPYVLINEAEQLIEKGQIEYVERQRKSSQKVIIHQQPRRVIDYEPLYVAIMEWLLKTRVGKSNSDTFILEESFIIKSEGGLQLLMSYFQFCVDQVKGRIMQDLCMLVKWNNQSAQFLLNNEEFHWWIIEQMYELQHEYNTRELSQFEFWVWDSGVKLYCQILKYALAYEKGGYQRIQQLSTYIRIISKPDKALASQFLIRLIIKQLLSSLNEYYKSELSSTFWINIYYVSFELFRLTVSDANVQPQNNDFIFQKFNRIANSLNIQSSELPKKWKQTFGNVRWLDSIYIQNICDFVNQVCSKTSPQLLASIDDFQIVQKGVQLGLEPLYIQEYTRIFEVMLFSYGYGQEGQKPVFVQLIQLHLQLGAEYYALNLESSENMKQLQQILNTLEKLQRVFIVVAENSREVELEDYQEKMVYKVIASHYNFLFQILRRSEMTNLEQEIKINLFNMINVCLVNSFKFLIIVVDVVANLFNKFDNYAVLAIEATRSNSTPLKMFVVRMLKDLYKADGSNLFEVKEAKTLKLNNKLIFQKIHQARDVFLENITLVEMIESMFFVDEEFYLLMKINTEDQARNHEQRFRNINYKLSQQRQWYEQVQFQLMETNIQLNEKIEKIDNEQIYIRRARYMFKRAFNSVRVFNQWWAHHDFEAQNNKSFDIDELEYEIQPQSRIFYWKMWKYETKQKSRPMLKPKLYDFPENNYTLQQIDEQNSQKQSRILNLVTYDKRVIKKQEKETQLMDKIINRINPMKLFQGNQTDELIIPQVQWIKTLTVRCGTLKVINEQLIFYFESINQKETHQSLYKFKVAEDQKLVKEWNLENLCDIQLRRYINRLNSLELTFKDGRTLLFNFPNKDQQLLIDKLVSLKKSFCVQLKQRVLYLKLDPWNIMQESKCLTKWFNYKITTFEYLMKLNKISGRSHKDLTQYPVFPWIMNDGEQLGQYRDLSKPMGALGNPDRVDVFRQRYNMVDHFNNVPRFHYGSHYSSPAIIFHFLIRLRPFSDGAKELQSGRFDLADRLFFSFVDTYRNAVEELSDVRELIPEFFYMPEMFTNISRFDFGLQQTGQRVHHVELPSWSGQNPYRFVCGHRMELESDYVSQNINFWIDLIFGYKQKGKEAEEALNKFYYLTYENSIDWEDQQNEKQRISIESQIIHFGQCPSQILDRPHPQRLKQRVCNRLTDEKIQITIYRQKPIDGSPVPKHLLQNFSKYRSIIKLQFVGENKVQLFRKNGIMQIVKLQSLSSEEKRYEIFWDKEVQFSLEKLIDENCYLFDWTCWYDEIPVLFRNKYIFIGGIWDGRLLIYNEYDKQYETYNDQDSTICVLRQDHNLNVLATGSKNGQLCIYVNGYQKILKLIAKHNNHDGPILDIYICDDLRVVVSSSTDGWVHIYNMWTGKYLRSFKHPKGHPIQKVAVFCTPLYGIIMYGHKTLYSYSINGQYLSHYELPQTIVNQAQLKIIKDSLLNDILIIPLNYEKKLLLLITPFLNIRSEMKLTPHINSMNELMSYSISPDRKILAFGTSDGEFGLALPQYLQN